MASRDSERPERSCSRVVLDANCVRGSPVEELVAIRARGFSLHASIEGVREVWAKSLRERAYDGLASRLARLGPLLDPQEPIAFAGTALLSLIGTIDARVSEKAARFRRDVVGGWWSVVGGGLNENAWQGIGAELQSELDAEQRGWMALVEEAKGIERKLKTQASEGITVGRARGVLIEALAKGAGVRTRPPIERRANLHLRYVTDKFLSAASRTPSVNDFQDARHLQHLAWPAFLATLDFRLIEDVDGTGSVQKLWVRTPFELVGTAVQPCEPWGKRAKRAALQQRLPIAVLKQEQRAFRDRVRDSGLDSGSA